MSTTPPHSHWGLPRFFLASGWPGPGPTARRFAANVGEGAPRLTSWVLAGCWAILTITLQIKLMDFLGGTHGSYMLLRSMGWQQTPANPWVGNGKTEVYPVEMRNCQEVIMSFSFCVHWLVAHCTATLYIVVFPGAMVCIICS